MKRFFFSATKVDEKVEIVCQSSGSFESKTFIKRRHIDAFTAVGVFKSRGIKGTGKTYFLVLDLLIQDKITNWATV